MTDESVGPVELVEDRVAVLETQVAEQAAQIAKLQDTVSRIIESLKGPRIYTLYLPAHDPVLQKQWEDKMPDHFSGITYKSPMMGRYKDIDGRLVEEGGLLVDILVPDIDEAEAIARMTKEHFGQEAVMMKGPMGEVIYIQSTKEGERVIRSVLLEELRDPELSAQVE